MLIMLSMKSLPDRHHALAMMPELSDHAEQREHDDTDYTDGNDVRYIQGNDVFFHLMEAPTNQTMRRIWPRRTLIMRIISCSSGTGLRRVARSRTTSYHVE